MKKDTLALGTGIESIKAPQATIVAPIPDQPPILYVAAQERSRWAAQENAKGKKLSSVLKGRVITN